MDYEDDFDNGYESDPVESGSGFDLSNEQGRAERDFDPLNFRDPVNAYFCLSDDAQTELENPQKRKMKCLSCEHEFFGQIGDYCPECYGAEFKSFLFMLIYPLGQGKTSQCESDQRFWVLYVCRL